MKESKNTSKSKLAIPAVAIYDNIVFSKKEAWAYFKINTVPFEFLDNNARASLGLATSIALSSLVQSGNQQVDCHVLVTNTPFSVDSWENQMIEMYDKWNTEARRTREFIRFIENQSSELRYWDYQKRVTYLGVKLFTRGSFSLDGLNILEFGFQEAYQTLKSSLNSLLISPTEEIMEKEENRAKVEEKEVFRVLTNGNLRATRVSSEELLLLMKKQLHPSMPSPLLEVDTESRAGLSDIARETVSVIEHNHRNLRVEQFVDGQIMEGYRATLSFASFPKSGMGLPSAIPPFMYFPTMSGMPFDMSSRFTLITSEKARKELDNKSLETDDALKNLAMTGQGANEHIATTLREIQEMERELEDKMPWVNGSYRLTIEMPTEELLATAITEIKQLYAEQDINLVLTSGDQLDLLLEEMPGGTLTMNSFNQMTNIAMVGTSGFNFGGVAGDPIDEKTVYSKKRRGK